MPLYPQGYHITFGTYGARLHGSNKPHVDRDHNQYGAPLAPRDPDREDDARNRMSDDPVKLTIEQRRIVERAILELCQRFNWPVHEIAPQSDHVYVVMTARGTGTHSEKRSKHPLPASSTSNSESVSGGRKMEAASTSGNGRTSSPRSIT